MYDPVVPMCDEVLVRNYAGERMCVYRGVNHFELVTLKRLLMFLVPKAFQV